MHAKRKDNNIKQDDMCFVFSFFPFNGWTATMSMSYGQEGSEWVSFFTIIISCTIPHPRKTAGGRTDPMSVRILVWVDGMNDSWGLFGGKWFLFRIVRERRKCFCFGVTSTSLQFILLFHFDVCFSVSRMVMRNCILIIVIFKVWKSDYVHACNLV